MRQVMWQKGGIASTHMTEIHAYGYSLKDTTRYAAGGLNFRSASRLALSTLCDPFCGRKTTNYEFIHSMLTDDPSSSRVVYSKYLVQADQPCARSSPCAPLSADTEDRRPVQKPQLLQGY